MDVMLCGASLLPYQHVDYTDVRVSACRFSSNWLQVDCVDCLHIHEEYGDYY